MTHQRLGTEYDVTLAWTTGNVATEKVVAMSGDEALELAKQRLVRRYGHLGKMDFNYLNLEEIR